MDSISRLYHIRNFPSTYPTYNQKFNDIDGMQIFYKLQMPTALRTQSANFI